MSPRTQFLTAVVLAAGALVMSGTGCELIASVDRGKIAGSGGGTGGTSTGGTGGTNTGGTNTGGTNTGGTNTGGTNTGGTGTGGTGPMCGAGVMTCTAPADCPDTGNECVQRTCDMGCCGTANVADLTPTTSGQTDKDCKSVVCDGAGQTKNVDDDNDAPDPADECHTASCVAGAGTQTPTSAGSACTVGGNVCDGNGTCIECLLDTDCTAPKVCDPVNNSHTCVDPGCTDGVQNGDETDQDCGGACGATCANGKMCMDGGDCASGVCGAGNTCAAPSCTDGVKNGNETDIDCGGATCGGGMGLLCDQGEGCNGPTDCNTGACNGVTCAYKPQGTGCNNHGECGAAGSNLCVDGVCCNTSCTTGCQACSAAKKGGGGDGLCGNIAAGNDPDGDCTDQTAASCGDNGLCDGAGACQKYPLNTVCGAATCTGNTLTAQLCNATNMCVAGGAMTCGGGLKCNSGGSACLTACAADADCASATDFCMNPGASGTCVAKKADGVACGASGECTNGNCVDGICCNNGCTGTCQACNVAGNLGTCTNVPSGGTDSTCAAPGVCDTGACVACVTNAQCTTPTPACNTATHTCVECVVANECASSVCDTLTHTCSAATCSDTVINGAETDVDCGGGTCGGCANGLTCLVDGDCLSGMCSEATGACEASINGCDIATATDLTGLASTDVTFPNGNFTFSPKCIKVSVGTDVVFNGDFSGHPHQGGEVVGGVEIATSSGPFAGTTSTGLTATFSMTTTGTFPYYCIPHGSGGMNGVVFVVP